MTEEMTPKTYTVEPDGFEGTYLVARSVIDGAYIGLPDFAQHLEDMGIAPQLAHPADKVASIGFSEREQKWFGWSHRAICGFGLGSIVKFGDCAYVPKDWDDKIRSAVAFWSSPGRSGVSGERGKTPEGDEFVIIRWTYASDEKLIPNKKLWRETATVVSYPPQKWGRGEWTAETLDDAKQMAVDFAEGVA